jgi:acid phosphatase class B
MIKITKLDFDYDGRVLFISERGDVYTSYARESSLKYMLRNNTSKRKFNVIYGYNEFSIPKKVIEDTLILRD